MPVNKVNNSDKKSLKAPHTYYMNIYTGNFRVIEKNVIRARNSATNTKKFMPSKGITTIFRLIEYGLVINQSINQS